MLNRSNWKLNLIAGGLVLAAFTASAAAQIHVYIGRTPPPLRYEVRPAMPGEGFVWTEGYWETMEAATSGTRAFGCVLPTPAPTGTIPTTTTTSRAGRCTRATGTTKTTTPTTTTATIAAELSIYREPGAPSSPLLHRG